MADIEENVAIKRVEKMEKKVNKQPPFRLR
jgi:hypothetical protein